MDFTVLLSVYDKESSDYLDLCFDSLYKQTLKATCIVVVKDGPIRDELNQVILKWQDKLPLEVVGYEENKGCYYALNYGLKYCKTELICRMDSDDISCSERFEKQIGFMVEHPEISLCSGYIAEFCNEPGDIKSIRTVPVSHEEICKGLKSRNAFNHMAVCFKKSAVENVGCYQAASFFEDYDLWIRMVMSGVKTYNIPEILVNARIGNDMIGRRHGLSYAKLEISFFKKQYKIGFISKSEYCKLIMMRVPLRLLPKQGLALVYKLLRK